MKVSNRASGWRSGKTSAKGSGAQIWLPESSCRTVVSAEGDVGFRIAAFVDHHEFAVADVRRQRHHLTGHHWKVSAVASIRPSGSLAAAS